jgi:hypothetical protein
MVPKMSADWVKNYYATGLNFIIVGLRGSLKISWGSLTIKGVPHVRSKGKNRPPNAEKIYDCTQNQEMITPNALSPRGNTILPLHLRYLMWDVDMSSLLVLIVARRQRLGLMLGLMTKYDNTPLQQVSMLRPLKKKKLVIVLFILQIR